MADQLTEGDGWAVITGPNHATIAFDPGVTNEQSDLAWAAALADGTVDWIETSKGALDEAPETTVVTVHYRTRVVEDVE